MIGLEHWLYAPSPLGHHCYLDIYIILHERNFSILPTLIPFIKNQIIRIYKFNEYKKYTYIS